MRRPLTGMPRTARCEVDAGIYHAITHAHGSADVFRDDRDRQRFLALFEEVIERCDWRCLSFCLLTNHVHAVIETRAPTLGTGMHLLLGRYAQLFNRRHGLRGGVYDDRFFARPVGSDEYFAQLLRYVALNPADPLRWPWSAHRVLLAGSPSPLVDSERVEELLEVWGGELGSRYARLFRPGQWLEQKYGDADPFTYRPPLAELLAGGDAGICAARDHGYRLREIAAHLGCSEATVSRRARKGTVPFLAPTDGASSSFPSSGTWRTT